MPWAAAAAVVGGALAAKGAKDAAKTQAQTARDAANAPWSSTQTQDLDPRISSMLFGGGGSPGILGQFGALASQPAQSDAAQYMGELSGNYIKGSAAEEFQRLRNANYDLMRGNSAPAIGAAVAQEIKTQAPSQNQLDLKSAYQNYIYGNPAENPYLKQSLQAGVDQSTQAFNTQLGNLTDTLQRQILPGIRGNAIAAGQFGSSRQGIAEGLAMSDLSKQATNAAQAFGLGNTAATTGAYANAFDAGQNRSLSALQGLGAQQYGVAQQDAAMRQQTELANAAARQAADNTNVQALLATRGQNNAANIAGQAGITGLLGNASQASNASNNAALSRAGQLSGLLAPYLGVGATSYGSGTGQPQPAMTQNTGANALGGAMAGLSLYNMFRNPGAGGGFGGSAPGIGSGMAAQFPNGY